MEKYGFVYIWFDKKHKRYYIGAHWGNENDGYVCSSSWMLKGYKRRLKDFKRRVLATGFETKKEMFEEENRWLDMIDEKEFGKRYYNLQKTWQHWSMDENKAKTLSEKISIRTKEAMARPEIREKYEKAMANKDLSFITDDWKKRKSESMKRKWANMLEEDILARNAKISKSSKGKVISKEQRKKISRALRGKMVGEKNGFYGKKHSEESLQKMRDSHKKNRGLC